LAKSHYANHCHSAVKKLCLGIYKEIKAYCNKVVIHISNIFTDMLQSQQERLMIKASLQIKISRR